jgi:hypothetical protein
MAIAASSASLNSRSFRVYRLPCDVTGIRVMLHTRNDGRTAPPTASETIAEATVPIRFRVVRGE